MNADDPYSTPTTESQPPKPSLIFWSIGAIFGAAIIGGLVGLAVGACLGTYAPGYYRSVFRNGDALSFDPLAVGIGQGLTQGIVFGGVIGVAAVALFYWYRSRST